MFSKGFGDGFVLVKPRMHAEGLMLFCLNILKKLIVLVLQCFAQFLFCFMVGCE